MLAELLQECAAILYTGDEDMEATRRVSFKSRNTWELGGESVLFCETVPNPPEPGRKTLVKITHTNVYGPVEDVAFFVRVGDPKNPTAFDDLDSATDWVKADLVEEMVCVDGKEMHRSEATAPFGREEVPWDGTFEAELAIPMGRSTIEIKVSSTGMTQSGVIADWVLEVR